MDAPEEDLDIKLQRASSELIAAFDQRLEPFLRKPDRSGGFCVRSRVRTREASYLMFHLLDPFQELPQLLDPHLPKWLPVLAEAFLEYLQSRRRRAREVSNPSSLLMPLRTAVCKLIYTLCKIRGEKVIVRFLNAGTKYLELLLTALEDAERHQDSEDASLKWTWEERYVVLLWLSHLMFVPFDLSTISSVYMEDVDLAGIPGFFWPSNVPGITVRILPLAVKYLACPGKERDAAKALLVRMAMRRDMQQLGVLHALVQWALFWLRPKSDEPAQSPYKYIGVLAFMAGVLASAADTSEMEKYSSTIFYTVHAISSSDDAMSEVVKSSALAKKTIIKVMRSIALSKLKRERQDMAGIELVETTIGHLLESLSDTDTPVRLAASKALSIITLNLPEDMASQVVEAVLDSLNRNVLWVNNPLDPSLPPTRDLTSVDPLEWHGLMLTLSHLLYRHSPPADNLGIIVRALLLGISFERRSPSGGSIGTNVRDAACFGIWALARRYSTKELLAVPAQSVRKTGSQEANISVLQILATDLVITASLDPAGNIRRGSSAALQELIGRHPDTVEKGIAMVQTVDYHSVALRLRAMHEVSAGATKLHSQYGEAILEALLGWRGIGDADAAARRVAGLSYGTITAELERMSTKDSPSVLLKSMDRVLRAMKTLKTRQVEERHGMLLALASIMDQLPELVNRTKGSDGHRSSDLAPVVSRAVSAMSEIVGFVKITAFRRPELIAEAMCRLFVSSFPVLQAEALGPDANMLTILLPGPALVSASDKTTFMKTVSQLEEHSISKQRIEFVVNSFREIVGTWLNRSEPEVIAAASEASLVLLIFSPLEQRDEMIRGWAELVRSRSRSGTGAGYFFALAKSYSIVAMSDSKAGKESNVICDALLERWSQDEYVEVRVSILQSLVQAEVLRENVHRLLRLISEGLEDYTTNARGDVGSHVRLQAIKATRCLWMSVIQSGPGNLASSVTIFSLLLPILRLAAEKLDRVRAEAQSTLALALRPGPSSQLLKLTFSSRTYFLMLLDVPTQDWLHESIGYEAKSDPERWMDELLRGYVTSADTGNEDLVMASRAALTDYCEAGQDKVERICSSLLRNMKAGQGQDRVLVPTVEIIAFLFSVGIYQRSTTVDMKSLCLQVQKAGYKSGNVRKLEACVKVYRGIAAMGIDRPGGGLEAMASEMLEQKRGEGIAEARKRLGALMVHPWPRVRSSVVDELWDLVSAGYKADKADRLKGMDWGRAERGAIKTLVSELALS